jgi:hypothetical protein
MMTSATEVLRRMLDERGLEWEGDDTPCVYPRTVWGEVGGFLHEAIEYSGGLNVTSEALNVTPEQAISATLGNGTCYNVSYRMDESRFHCSECESGGWWKDVADGRDKVPRHCPNCGRKVVGE